LVMFITLKLGRTYLACTGNNTCDPKKKGGVI
jgi:hypothetical protein